MRRNFTFFFLLALSAGLFAQTGQDCSDLIISEYVEGTGNNKAIEIYNTSDHIIDLGEYYIARYSNGSTSYTGGGVTRLQGFIQPHTTFVLVNGQTTDQDLGGGSTSPKADPALQALADQLDHPYPAPTYMNGNDAIALLFDPDGGSEPTVSAVAIDLFGTIGHGMTSADEGWADTTDIWIYMNVYEGDVIVGKDSAYINDYIVPEGYYWVPWTENHSLVRKPDVKKGVTTNPDVFDVKLQWDTIPGGADQWDSLGSHTCDCAPKTNAVIPRQAPKAYIFPNPTTNGHFTISTNEPVKELEVINMLGQTVLKRENTGSNVDVDLPEGRKGIYFVRLKFENQKLITRKLLVR